MTVENYKHVCNMKICRRFYFNENIIFLLLCFKEVLNRMLPENGSINYFFLLFYA